jgi:hypothetical protein
MRTRFFVHGAETNSLQVLALYSLEANLGIHTAPGTKPAYLTVESANYGIIDPNPNLETGETR